VPRDPIDPIAVALHQRAECQAAAPPRALGKLLVDGLHSRPHPITGTSFVVGYTALLPRSIAHASPEQFPDHASQGGFPRGSRGRVSNARASLSSNPTGSSMG